MYFSNKYFDSLLKILCIFAVCQKNASGQSLINRVLFNVSGLLSNRYFIKWAIIKFSIKVVIYHKTQEAHNSSSMISCNLKTSVR